MLIFVMEKQFQNEKPPDKKNDKPATNPEEDEITRSIKTLVKVLIVIEREYQKTLTK